MLFSKVGAAATLFAALVSGEVFTTIDPCPAAPKNITSLHQTITVTKQHQAVSTCTKVDKSVGWSSYSWVSTVIPCWGKENITSCTVTKTDQVVPCSGTMKTITSIIPTSTRRANGTYSTYNVTQYTTVSKGWAAPYNKIGPFAIPGYAGCELCEDCGVQNDGNKKQQLNGIECTTASGKQPVCSGFADTWISSAVPTTTGAVSAEISQHTVIPSPGEYTFYFPQPAPTTTIESQGQWYTVPAEPWTATVTKSFDSPQDYDIYITVTRTVYYNKPYDVDTQPEKTPLPQGLGEWGSWNDPAATTTADSNSQRLGGERPGPGDWQSQWQPSATPAPSSKVWTGGHWGDWASGDIKTTLSTKTSSTTSQPEGNVKTTTSSTTTSQLEGNDKTTTSSTTTSLPEETAGFYIQVDYTGLRRRYVKRADVTYIGFSDGSDDASLVSAEQNPARFFFDEDGFLRTGSEYIASDSSSGYFVFEKTRQKPSSPPPYAKSGDSFIRTSNGGFCATPTNFFISISGAPSNCKPVTCKAPEDPKQPITTTKGTSTSPTTTYTEPSTTTTKQPDVSADPDVPDPATYRTSTATGKPTRR